jgi:transposase
MKQYCGVDLHSNVYAIKDKDGKILLKKRLGNDLDLILRELSPYKDNLESIAVESTYNWYWLVDGLMANGYNVRLANPAAIDQYDGLKDANDNTDALFLAELLRLDILKEGYIYPKSDRPIRDLLRRRMLFVQHRTAIMLSLEGILCRETGRQLSWRQVCRLEKEDIKELVHNDKNLLFTINHEMKLVSFLNDKIDLFEKKILEQVDFKDDYKLLLGVPGIGKILGLTILLEVGDIDRFRKVGNFTSYCRCARAKHTSNGKTKANNNRKNGNKYLSWAFVEAAHHAIGCSESARNFYHQKKEKKNGTLATKALASKWTKAVYYVLKRQEPFDIRRVFG